MYKTSAWFKLQVQWAESKSLDHSCIYKLYTTEFDTIYKGNAVQYNSRQYDKKILEWITHTKSKFYISGRLCVHVRVFLYKTYFLNYLVYSE